MERSRSVSVTSPERRTVRAQAGTSKARHWEAPPHTVEPSQQCFVRIEHRLTSEPALPSHDLVGLILEPPQPLRTIRETARASEDVAPPEETLHSVIRATRDPLVVNLHIDDRSESSTHRPIKHTPCPLK